MSGIQSESGNSKSLLKTVLIYIFLLYLAYVVSDLVILKFISPQFMVKLSAKDKIQKTNVFELETNSFEISDLGSKGSFTDKIVRRNIFNSQAMPVPIAKLNGEDRSEKYEDSEPVLSGLELTLEGTAVHRNPFRSLATITGQGKTFSYTVGDEVAGMAEIISVIRKKVIIRNLQNKRFEYIEIPIGKVQEIKAITRNKLRPSKPKELIRRDGNRFTAKRSDVEKQLSNAASLFRQAKSRLARDPATGEILGYQIFGIKSGLLQDLGVQDNDIISSVNGMEIKNPIQATSVFGKLKSASEINVVVNRGGSTVELEYIIE